LTRSNIKLPAVISNGWSAGFGHQNSLSVVQLVERGLSLFQVARVEAFAEPAVDRREKLAGLLPFALIAPQPG
jgi:hypothetical protein